MVRRVVGMILVPLVSLAAGVTPALARAGAVQATDPNADSPAGVVYSIPLDSARQDAAPHHAAAGVTGGGTGGTGGGSGAAGGGTGGAGGGGSAAGSSGAGSGTSATGAVSTRTASKVVGAAAVLIPGGQPGSLVHSANGFGSSSSVPGLDAPAGSGLGAVQGNASSAPLLAILLSIVLLSIGGFVGRRAWHSSSGELKVTRLLGPGSSSE